MSNLEQGDTVSPKRSEILKRADTIVNGDRQNDYGPPEENFQRIAEFWTTYLGRNLTNQIQPRQVAEMLILLKAARLIQSPTEDTFIDIAGYASLAAELSDNEKKTAEVKTIVNIVSDSVYSISSEQLAETVANSIVNSNFSKTNAWRDK